MRLGRASIGGFALVCGIGAFWVVCGAPLFGQTDEPAPKTTVYLHGRIYTNDPKQPWAAAMAVKGDKIRCIGTLEHILLDCGGNVPGVETIQLHGGFLMPGFNDAHTHLGEGGADLLAVRLNGAT